MTELADLVGAYQREVAIPGGFTSTFPDTTEADLVAGLADAFAQAQLEGFFPTHTLQNNQVTPDLSAGGQALIVLYAGARMIRHRLLSMAVGKRYKAGPTEYETSPVASLLTEMLKSVQKRVDTLLSAANDPKLKTTVYMTDSYPARSGVGRFYASELPGGW